MNDFSAVPIAAGEGDLPIGLSCGFKFFECGDEPHMVFPRMFEPRDIQKKWAFQAESFRVENVCLVARTGMETFVAQAVVNHGDAFARQTEELYNVSSSIFADRNDSIFSLRESSGDDAPIKHPFPVILFGDMKWGEVVNR